MIVAVLCCLLCGTCMAENEYAISEQGINFIKNQEGFTPYRVWDHSQYSIGYGTAVSAGAYPNGITRAEADVLLLKSLANVEKKLNDFIFANAIPLGQEQYDCLVSFTYNVGTNWLKGCRLTRLLTSEGFTGIDFASAIGVWCHAGSGSAVNSGLVLRRVREIQLFLHGDYSGKESPNYVYVLFDSAGGDILTDIYFYPQGSAYGYLQPAEKDGTMFLGWYKSDGGQLTESTVATKNLRVSARWQNPHPAVEAFTDIYENAWYYGYVDNLYNGGVIQGYADKTFRPSGKVTVGEALKMIFVAAGYPAQTPTPTDPGQWASGYRALAVTLEIFKPDEYADLNVSANRSMIAMVAAQALKLTEQPEPEEDGPIFADTEDPNVLALYNVSIVEGSLDEAGKRHFKPESSITRAELCAIVSRIMNYK